MPNVRFHLGLFRGGELGRDTNNFCGEGWRIAEDHFVSENMAEKNAYGTWMEKIHFGKCVKPTKM